MFTLIHTFTPQRLFLAFDKEGQPTIVDLAKEGKAEKLPANFPIEKFLDLAKQWESAPRFPEHEWRRPEEGKTHFFALLRDLHQEYGINKVSTVFGSEEEMSAFIEYVRKVQKVRWDARTSLDSAKWDRLEIPENPNKDDALQAKIGTIMTPTSYYDSKWEKIPWFLNDGEITLTGEFVMKNGKKWVKWELSQNNTSRGFVWVLLETIRFPEPSREEASLTFSEITENEFVDTEVDIRTNGKTYDERGKYVGTLDAKTGMKFILTGNTRTAEGKTYYEWKAKISVSGWNEKSVFEWKPVYASEDDLAVGSLLPDAGRATGTPVVSDAASTATPAATTERASSSPTPSPSPASTPVPSPSRAARVPRRVEAENQGDTNADPETLDLGEKIAEAQKNIDLLLARWKVRATRIWDIQKNEKGEYVDTKENDFRFMYDAQSGNIIYTITRDSFWHRDDLLTDFENGLLKEVCKAVGGDCQPVMKDRVSYYAVRAAEVAALAASLWGWRKWLKSRKTPPVRTTPRVGRPTADTGVTDVTPKSPAPAPAPTGANNQASTQFYANHAGPTYSPRWVPSHPSKVIPYSQTPHFDGTMRHHVIDTISVPSTWFQTKKEFLSWWENVIQSGKVIPQAQEFLIWWVKYTFDGKKLIKAA